MTEREPRTVRVDPEVWEEFSKFVVEKHGSKRGELPREVENALQEYMDRDRYQRIEDKLDTVLARLPNDPGGHTHTQPSHGQQASETVQKTRTIASRIADNHAPVVREADLEQAIEDIAGGHKQTVTKYKNQLRKRELLFEHPGDSVVWTTEKDKWAKWVDDYVDALPGDRSRDLADVLEGYDIAPDGFVDYTEAVLEQ